MAVSHRQRDVTRTPCSRGGPRAAGGGAVTAAGAAGTRVAAGSAARTGLQPVLAEHDKRQQLVPRRRQLCSGSRRGASGAGRRVVKEARALTRSASVTARAAASGDHALPSSADSTSCSIMRCTAGAGNLRAGGRRGGGGSTRECSFSARGRGETRTACRRPARAGKSAAPAPRLPAPRQPWRDVKPLAAGRARGVWRREKCFAQRPPPPQPRCRPSG